jgi:hypothetical protein
VENSTIAPNNVQSCGECTGKNRWLSNRYQLRVNVIDRLCNLLHEYCAQLRGRNWKADEAFGATHKATYRDVGNAMNHEYTDAAVEQRESHEDESQDWDLLFVGLAC